MPYYTTQFERGSFTYFISDKPDISGLLRSDGQVVSNTDFLGVTVELVKTNQILQAETFVPLDSNGGFLFTFLSTLETQTNGNVFVRALPQAGAGTVDAPISQSELGNKSITITSGAIPNSGWALVNSEIVEFARVDATTINITARGQFITDNVAHLTAAPIAFAGVKEFAQPAKPFIVYDTRLY